VRTNGKVLVNGSIRIGTQLELVRDIPENDPSGKLRVKAIADEWVRVSQGTIPDDPGGSGVREDRYVYSLRPTADELVIVDQGLCQSYGIFGNPGVGKTVLLMNLLRQILGHAGAQSEQKFGGIILDPKAALMDEVAEAVRDAGRQEDLVIINESLMRSRNEQVNIVESHLSPYDLGKALALAAQSAGITSKEPYWLNELGAVFGAGLQLWQLMQRRWGRRANLRDLVDLLLTQGLVQDSRRAPAGSTTKYVLRLETALDDAADYASRLTAEEREELEICRGTLERFRQSKDYWVLSSFIDQAYGQFRRRQYAMLSQELKPGAVASSIYDGVIEDGKIVLVSVSKSSLAISRMLCTLIKTLFQQTVLTRLERYRSGALKNYTRPVFFMADEYSDVATELAGSPMGDALFFSQMRQFGCMAIIATQSVQMLKAAGLEDTWKAIYGNLAAKIFMQTGDPETAEEASKLVGESKTRFRNTTRTWSPDGTNRSENNDLKDVKDLPTKILLQTLGLGQAVVIGNTDGSRTRPGIWFVEGDPPPLIDHDAGA